MDRLNEAIREAEVFAHGLGMTNVEGDGAVGRLEDPALQKIIEVASEYLDDPECLAAFDFTMAKELSR